VGSVIKFPDLDPGPTRPGMTARTRNQSKLSVISCRGSDDLDARLKQTADRLHLTKSQLIHDIAVRFLEQTGKQRLLRASSLDRAQRTRELARELFELWGDGPECSERKAA
jgi:hypothetical protein